MLKLQSRQNVIDVIALIFFSRMLINIVLLYGWWYLLLRHIANNFLYVLYVGSLGWPSTTTAIFFVFIFSNLYENWTYKEEEVIIATMWAFFAWCTPFQWFLLYSFVAAVNQHYLLHLHSLSCHAVSQTLNMSITCANVNVYSHFLTHRHTLKLIIALYYTIS